MKRLSFLETKGIKPISIKLTLSKESNCLILRFVKGRPVNGILKAPKHNIRVQYFIRKRKQPNLTQLDLESEEGQAAQVLVRKLHRHNGKHQNKILI